MQSLHGKPDDNRRMSTSTALPVMMTTKQVADAFQQDESTITRRCQNGGFRGAVKVSPKRWLIPASTIAEILGVAS